MHPKKGEKYTGFFAKHRLAVATSTLIGTVVGAGVLGIPYVIAKAGFLYGSLITLLIGVAFLFLNLFAGEMVLRTKKQFQLTGYMQKYLGNWGKRIMAFSMVFGIYGALTAFLIGEGQVLQTIFGGSSLLFTLLFFFITTLIVYRGVKATGKVELILMSLLFVVVMLIGIFSFRSIDLSNFAGFNPSQFFLPYGVILFAFVGLAAVPEVQEVLEKDKRNMKKALVIGSIVPVLLYILFSVIVIGVVGLDNFELLAPNERIATVALSVYSNSMLGLFANIFAVVTMFTSFLTLAIALAEMYEYDFHLHRTLALGLTLAVPLLLATSGFTTFIATLGITGAIAGGLDGILLVLAYWKAKKKGDRKPEYSVRFHRIPGVIVIIMFSMGLVTQNYLNRQHQ